MNSSSINTKIAVPAPSIKIDDKVTHMKTSHVKLQQETIMTLSTQTATNAIFNAQDAFVDFIIPPNSAALSQAEKIVLQMNVAINYPVSTATPTAYILPPTYRWIDRIELFSGMQLLDTIRGDHLFFHNTFLHQEELANKGKLELFNTETYDLANEYPGLYVVQTGINEGGVQNARCYLTLDDTFLTAHGFFLPKISKQLLVRYYFKTFDKIKPTYSGNAPLSMALSSSQMIISGVKYSPEEEENLFKNDYNNKYSVKTFVRRWNEVRLNPDVNGFANIDVSYLRGTFSTVGFFILPNSQANGEMGIQKVLYQALGGSNLGVNGLVNNVKPSRYGSTLDYSLNYPINYAYTPETYAIKTFNFLDSSNRPLYVTNQDGNILRNSIPNNNSEVDFQSKYAIYRFDFTNNSQKDIEDESASGGYRWIDGLYSLNIQTENDISALTYVDITGQTKPLNPQIIGLGYQCAEIIIESDGDIKILRH